MSHYSFVPDLLTEDLTAQRRAILEHPWWTAVQNGTATTRQLQVFALQDDWLVRHSQQLESLLVAHAPDEATRATLLKKWEPKAIFNPHSGPGSLRLFGAAVGLSVQDFERVQPMAGCAALTMNFYYALVRGGFLGLLASIAASESIFIHLCEFAGPALRDNYGLTDEQVAFFPLHDRLKEGVEVGEAALLRQLCRSDADRQRVTEAFKLTYECERQFYDTVYAAQ